LRGMKIEEGRWTLGDRGPNGAIIVVHEPNSREQGAPDLTDATQTC
jgi:hypothetical protein